MAVKKSGSVFALGLRVARLAADGLPLVGVKNTYLTDNLVKIDYSLEYRDGVEVERLNGQGKACLYYSAPATVKRLTIDSLELCFPDPELEEMLGGGTVLMDSADAVGYAAPAVGSVPVPNGVSIEAWSSAINADGIDSSLPYIHWVFPRENLRPSSRSLSSEAMAAGFEGEGSQNPKWGKGPNNDWTRESGRVFQWAREATIPTLSTNGLVPTVAQTP